MPRSPRRAARERRADRGRARRRGCDASRASVGHTSSLLNTSAVGASASSARAQSPRGVEGQHVAEVDVEAAANALGARREVRVRELRVRSRARAPARAPGAPAVPRRRSARASRAADATGRARTPRSARARRAATAKVSSSLLLGRRRDRGEGAREQRRRPRSRRGGRRFMRLRAARSVRRLGLGDRLVEHDAEGVHRIRARQRAIADEERRRRLARPACVLRSRSASMSLAVACVDMQLRHALGLDASPRTASESKTAHRRLAAPPTSAASWKSDSCSSQNLPCTPAHIAASAAALRVRVDATSAGSSGRRGGPCPSSRTPGRSWRRSRRATACRTGTGSR